MDRAQCSGFVQRKVKKEIAKKEEETERDREIEKKNVSPRGSREGGWEGN